MAAAREFGSNRTRTVRWAHPPAVELMLRCLEGAPWGVYSEFVENTEREEYYRMYASHVRARQEWWKNSEAIPYIGIVASEQTRLLLGKDTLPKYFSHTFGASRAAFEQHWPIRVLSEYDLENADLQGIRVLVLPDVRVLSDRLTEVVRRFVKAGAGLVASGGTGLFNENLTRRGQSARSHSIARCQSALPDSGYHRGPPTTRETDFAVNENSGWRGGDRSQTGDVFFGSFRVTRQVCGRTRLARAWPIHLCSS
jgi:hypothetical protein